MATDKNTIWHQISGAEDITTEIISRCEKILENCDEYKQLKKTGKDFKSIAIYGTIKDPCFKAKDIYLYLDPSGTNQTWFNKQLKPVIHVFKAPIEVLKSNSNNKTWTKVELTNMLTRKGLTKALSIGNGIIAETFQDYIYELLDTLWTNERSIMIKNMKTVEKLLELERYRRQDAERINRENLFLREAYACDFDTTSDEKTEIALLRRQHMSVYYLYLVDWAHVNSKYWRSRKDTTSKSVQPQKPIVTITIPNIIEGIDLHSDDEPVDEKTPHKTRRVAKADITAIHKDGIQDPYDAEYLSISDLESNENDEYYFHISHTETEKEYLYLIKPIYLDKTVHYNKMIDYIINGEKVISRTAYPMNSFPDHEILFPTAYTSATPMSKVYKTTYSKIMSARSRAFIHIHREELIGATNKKKRTHGAYKSDPMN